jgi:hypothetical protein
VSIVTLAAENRIRLAVARAGESDPEVRALLWELLKDLTPGVRK